MRNFTLSISCLICVFFQSTSLYSQDNFISASIITNEGDTLKGFIKYKEWERNPKSIKFKTSESSKPIRYTPADINSFLVDNDYYKSMVIDVTYSPREIKQLIYETVYETRIDTSFVLSLVIGKASLYEYVDVKSTKHYYLLTENDSLHELIYFKYFVEDNGTKVIKENPKYVGQLILLLRDCQDLKQKIWNSKYNATGLINVVSTYNECIGQENEYVHKVKKNKMKFGIIAGVTITTIQFEDISGWEYLNNTDFNNSIYPTLGFSFEMAFPRVRGKWSWYSDILIKSHYYNRTYFEQFNDDFYINYDLNLGATYLKYTTMGRYHIVGHKLVPYFDAGLYLSYLLAFKNEKTVDRHFYNSHITKTSAIFNNGVFGFDFGLVAGVGLKFHDFNLDIRYDIGGIANYTGFDSYTQAFYFLLGYTF